MTETTMQVLENRRCPRCGELGSGPHERKVGRGGQYTAFYFGHSREHAGKNHKVKWCYLTRKMAEQLLKSEIESSLAKLEQVEGSKPSSGQ